MYHWLFPAPAILEGAHGNGPPGMAADSATVRVLVFWRSGWWTDRNEVLPSLLRRLRAEFAAFFRLREGEPGAKAKGWAVPESEMPTPALAHLPASSLRKRSKEHSLGVGPYLVGCSALSSACVGNNNADACDFTAVDGGRAGARR